MIGESKLSLEKPPPSPLPEVSILRDIIALLWEKTQNLERIQATYEEELANLTAEVAQQSTKIEQLTSQLRSVNCADQGLQEDGAVPGLSVASLSETSEEPMSPGLSPAYSHSFANNRAPYVTCSKNERSASFDSFEKNEAEISRAEQQRIPPILVTTLSYDTSVYNGSVSPVNSSDIEGEILIKEDVNPSNRSNVSMANRRNISNVTLTQNDDIEEDGSTQVDKSEKRRDVVSQVYVAKMPVVLKENSVDSAADSEERDQFIVTPLQRKNPKDVLSRKSDENLAHFNWTRSDTFDVIPISQSSVIAVPVKPKRGVISPLHTQRHPTERDDTVISISRPEVTFHMTPSRVDHHLATHHKPIETCSEHSTFSQESCYSSSGGDGSSSFDYEVQYITPQLSDPEFYSEEECGWARLDHRNNFREEDFQHERGGSMVPDRGGVREWLEEEEEELLTPR